MMTNEDKAFAFGKGSDDRLAGVNYKHCPFWFEDEVDCWQAGWRDVENYWGVDAKWPVRKLVAVRG